ncbi:hypothetical protein RR42_s2991 [Cupriavidus basilensis]|uniref:Uncharacterized protein n=1 Tax=Cupriavidus basilensis TaxID=68895 RepID=A0A0C4YFJ2_9BURK|nr:hypothetical protein RR42_s2991 [Cupriavidus basilensis]
MLAGARLRWRRSFAADASELRQIGWNKHSEQLGNAASGVVMTFSVCLRYTQTQYNRAPFTAIS